MFYCGLDSHHLNKKARLIRPQHNQTSKHHDLNIDFYSRCIATLDGAYQELQKHETREITYDIYCAVCVKEFEIILEQSGRLLKKRLTPFFASNKAVDSLTFKDIFRHAAKHSIIDTKSCERWLQYQDNRNSTAHDYGVQFAESTLKILPTFIEDARQLAQILAQATND
jgi:nucleotidyltransferase substrate binding protein (TIGR01987 family)